MKRVASATILLVLGGCVAGPDGTARFEPAKAATAAEATTAAVAPFAGPAAPIVIAVGALAAALFRARAKKNATDTPTNGGTP